MKLKKRIALLFLRRQIRAAENRAADCVEVAADAAAMLDLYTNRIARLTAMLDSMTGLDRVLRRD